MMCVALVVQFVVRDIIYSVGKIMADVPNSLVLLDQNMETSEGAQL
jgi:hypothetical protein